MANEDWMDGFTDDDTRYLTDLVLPASHDAGVSQSHYDGYWKGSSAKHTIAQRYDIAGQLAAGSRFFDLRIGRHNGQLHTFHGEGLGSLGGGWGESAQSIFQAVDAFLAAHTGEIVILRISHTDESKGAHTLLLNSIAAQRLCCLNRNIAGIALSELRGKAIAIFDEKALSTPQPQQGLHRFVKYGDARVDHNFLGLAICGKYAGVSADMDKVGKTAIEQGNAHSDHQKMYGRHTHLFMVYWQLAFDIKSKTGKGYHGVPVDPPAFDDNQGPHYNLAYLAHVHRGNPGVGIAYKGTTYQSTITQARRKDFRPNIINLDFVSKAICDEVIALNGDLL